MFLFNIGLTYGFTALGEIRLDQVRAAAEIR
jgi:hypothetical protein